MACRALPAFPPFLPENPALGNGDIAILCIFDYGISAIS
jgi:hypothetical protein